MNNTLKQFEKHQYMALETFRKNGEAVKTPVWFVQDGETLRIWTEAGSGKVKRILRDGKARIAPSTADGRALGKWTDAKVEVLDASEEVKYTEDLLRKKYGWMFNIFAFLGKTRGGKHVTVKAKITSTPQ